MISAAPRIGLLLAIELAADRSEGAEERRAALIELFEVEGRALVRLARIFTDDTNAAEDLVQEAFIRLYRSMGEIEDKSKSAPYLRSIVLNLCRDHNRRGLMSLRHLQTSVDVAPVDRPDDLVVRTEQQAEVIDALLALSVRQRECLVLRYYSDMSESEIASTLGISPNSVKTHCKRGMDSLRDTLGERR
jgi:RNA polymerase sigma-70 factor (sigma-E family)